MATGNPNNLVDLLSDSDEEDKKDPVDLCESDGDCGDFCEVVSADRQHTKHASGNPSAETSGTSSGSTSPTVAGAAAKAAISPRGILRNGGGRDKNKKASTQRVNNATSRCGNHTLEAAQMTRRHGQEPRLTKQIEALEINDDSDVDQETDPDGDQSKSHPPLSSAVGLSSVPAAPLPPGVFPKLSPVLPFRCIPQGGRHPQQRAPLSPPLPPALPRPTISAPPPESVIVLDWSDSDEDEARSVTAPMAAAPPPAKSAKPSQNGKNNHSQDLASRQSGTLSAKQLGCREQNGKTIADRTSTSRDSSTITSAGTTNTATTTSKAHGEQRGNLLLEPSPKRPPNATARNDAGFQNRKEVLRIATPQNSGIRHRDDLSSSGINPQPRVESYKNGNRREGSVKPSLKTDERVQKQLLVVREKTAKMLPRASVVTTEKRHQTNKLLFETKRGLATKPSIRTSFQPAGESRDHPQPTKEHEADRFLPPTQNSSRIPRSEKEKASLITRGLSSLKPTSSNLAQSRGASFTKQIISGTATAQPKSEKTVCGACQRQGDEGKAQGFSTCLLTVSTQSSKSTHQINRTKEERNGKHLQEQTKVVGKEKEVISPSKTSTGHPVTGIPMELTPGFHFPDCDEHETQEKAKPKTTELSISARSRQKNPNADSSEPGRPSGKPTSKRKRSYPMVNISKLKLVDLYTKVVADNKPQCRKPKGTRNDILKLKLGSRKTGTDAPKNNHTSSAKTASRVVPEATSMAVPEPAKTTLAEVASKDQPTTGDSKPVENDWFESVRNDEELEHFARTIAVGRKKARALLPADIPAFTRAPLLSTKPQLLPDKSRDHEDKRIGMDMVSPEEETTAQYEKPWIVSTPPNFAQKVVSKGLVGKAEIKLKVSESGGHQGPIGLVSPSRRDGTDGEQYRSLCIPSIESNFQNIAKNSEIGQSVSSKPYDVSSVLEKSTFSRHRGDWQKNLNSKSSREPKPKLDSTKHSRDKKKLSFGIAETGDVKPQKTVRQHFSSALTFSPQLLDNRTLKKLAHLAAKEVVDSKINWEGVYTGASPDIKDKMDCNRHPSRYYSGSDTDPFEFIIPPKNRNTFLSFFQQATSCSRNNLSSVALSVNSPSIWTNDYREDDDTSTDTVEDEIPPNLMTEVSSLTRYQNINGLPSKTIFVYPSYSDDSILYEFQLTVGTSQIPNSGNGAFVEFVGAHQLKPHFKRKREDGLKSRDLREPETMRALEAVHPSGHGIQVKLKGEGLHGNFNSLAWPKSLEAKVDCSGQSKDVTVFLTCDEVFYDQEELSRMKRSDTFGLQRQNLFQDYERMADRDVVFSSQNPKFGLISMGRYGPFSKHDRKCKVEHELKAWVFGCGPSEWAFGVSEPLRGCGDQLIDITDDTTGETHSLARSNVPMYVNEVGHDTDLVQNVCSKEGDGRTVEYFLDLKDSIKPGEKVELLTNYDVSYEPTRERKGYGQRNLDGECKSDNDEASRLEREFIERHDVVELVESLSPTEIFYSLQFLIDRITEPLDKLLEGSVVNEKARRSIQQQLSVSSLQILARTRIHWLKDIFVARIQSLTAEKPSSKILPRSQFKISRNAKKEYRGQAMELMLRQSLEMAAKLEWQPLRQSAVFGATKAIQNTLERESIEEVMFMIRKSFPFPMEKNVWCGLSREHVEDACLDLSRMIRSGRICKNKLPEVFSILAKRAGKLARHTRRLILQGELDGLCFHSGTEGKLFVETGQNFNFEAFFQTFSPVLKGAVSALFDYKNNKNGTSENTPKEIGIHENVVMVKVSGDTDCLESLPRPNRVHSTDGFVVNERWYITWQVAFPFHCIGKGLVEHFAGHETDHILEFCSRSIIRAVDLQAFGRQTLACFADGVALNLLPPQTNFYRAEASLSDLDGKKSRTAGKRKCSRSSGGTQSKKQRVNRMGGERLKWLFDNLIWKTLENLDWTVTYGNRPTDRYFIPPGVVRGRGFRCRVDFFDSVKQVIDTCRSHPKWKVNPQVKESLALYDKCGKYYLVQKKMPKGEMKLDWLVEQATQEFG